MKRAFCSTVLFLTLVSWALPQDKAIYASYGIATFHMDDMKYYQELLMETFPVEGKIISSFPAYSYSTVGFFKQVSPVLRLGAGYGYASTGSRANYTDYSGTLSSEIAATSHRIGLTVAYRLAGGDPLELLLSGRVDANFSRVEALTSIYVLGFSDGFFSNYRAVNPSATGGLELLYHTGTLSFGVEAGYRYDVPGKLGEADSRSKLQDPNDRQRILTTDWSGIRAGIKALIWLDW
jgi:hypothetical protein